jgi:hypothetical protein
MAKEWPKNRFCGDGCSKELRIRWSCKEKARSRVNEIGSVERVIKDERRSERDQGDAGMGESESANRPRGHRRSGPERNRESIRDEGDGGVEEMRRICCSKREQRREERGEDRGWN